VSWLLITLLPELLAVLWVELLKVFAVQLKSSMGVLMRAINVDPATAPIQ
jgi:hypothetical protein